ncbi:PTS fructose transporter subunit IIBC [Edwardsiella ictaluri]|uniref:PTS fructose transporter subunit IIBC n=1 Tax=Edwardsiella ictaluri TaxID=67780 RepID=UPI0037834BFA
MNTLLITEGAQGEARCFLARRMLEAVAAQQQITWVTRPQDAALVLFIGDDTPQDAALEGKPLYRGSVGEAIRQPAELLARALRDASPYHCAAPRQDRSQCLRLVAVTACPTGVAHTFMAAEALEAEARRRGWQVKVETRGSVGAGNAITPQEVAEADLVVVAADIEVDLAKFAGKPMYRTSTGLALKKTSQELDRALQEAEIYRPQTSAPSGAAASGRRKEAGGAYRHLLTGVSYMLPMVVAGGLCIALSFVFGIQAFKEPGTLAAALMQIGGGTAFALMVPVLAGYIAFSIADRPGLTPGLIGGMLAVSLGSGFIGGIIAGFLAGYVARAISSRLTLPASMEALKPILIIPLLSSLIVGLAMIYIIGTPVAKLLAWLTHWLQTMGTANAVILGAVLGAMMCTDMGGPVNKAAYAFGVGLLSTQTYGPMAAIMAAGMVPPLAMGLATLVARRKFAQSEREGGKAAVVLGLCFITEGAIPFAARDPMRVLPCCILGGALTGALSMLFGAKLMTPHGGLFVLLIPGAISPVVPYLLAILAGTLLSGLLYALLKRPDVAPQERVTKTA